MKIQVNGYLLFKKKNCDLKKTCVRCNTDFFFSYRDIALKFYKYEDNYLPITTCPICFETEYVHIEYPYLFFSQTLKRKQKWLRWFFKDKKWLSLNKIRFKIYDLLLFNLGFYF